MSDADLVHVTLPDGRIGTVPKAELAQQLKIAPGARLSTPEEIEGARPVTASGVAATALGVDNPQRTAAGLAGVARGVSMGASDQDALQIAYGLGGEGARTKVREELKSLKEQHPYFSAAGEIEGAILPAIASGGAAAPRIATAAEPLLGREAAQLAPTIAERAITPAESLAAKFPGYVENVGLEGQALAREAAPIAQETAAAHEQAVSQIGKEVLGETSVGRAVGAPAVASGGTALPADVVSEVGELVEKGVVKALGSEGKTLLSKMLIGSAKSAARGATEGAIYGAVDELNEERLGDTGLNGEKMLASIGYGALLGGATGGVLGGGGPLARHVGTELAAKVDGLAGEQAFKALSPHPARALTQMAENIPGGARAVGEILLDKKLMRAGDTVEDILARVSPAKQQTGEALAAMRDALDAKGIHGPVIERIFRDFDENVTKRLETLPSLNKGAIDRIEGLRNDIASYAVDGKLSFTKAQELRARIDDSIRFTAPAPGAPANEINDALKGMRRSFEKEVEAAIDRGGSGHGPEYKELKDTYRKLSLAEDVLEDGIVKKLKNRTISPTDYLVGLGSLAAGHPLIGLASSFAHHVVRERGNSTAAVLLDKIGALGVVRDAAARVDRQIARGVGRAFGEKLAPVRVRPQLHAGPEGHGERIETVMRSLSEDHGERVGTAVAPIAPHAPGVAGAVVRAAARSAAYLQSLLPHETQDPGLQPHLRDVSEDMNSSERARFERAYHVVNDPVSVLPRLEDGSLTPDEVEALKATNPEMYKQIANEIAEKLAATKGPIPNSLRSSIATFLGDPSFAGPTATPEYVALMQQSYAPTQAPQGRGGRKGRGGSRSSKGPDLSKLLDSRSLDNAIGKDFKL